MSGQELDSGIVPVDRAVEVADARLIRIALVGIGARRGAQKVELPIHRQMRHRIDIALDETRDAALPRGHAKFVGMRRRTVAVRNSAIAGANIGEFLTGAIHGFRREEAAQRDRYALEANLLVLGRRRGLGGRGLVIDLVLQRLEFGGADLLLRRRSR
ncbi:MAG: hypothetical protein ACREHV_13640 [Rhizomicrobium sp.]